VTICYATSECVPFVKTGGLADVLGSLPRFVSNEGHESHLFLPRYRQIDPVSFGFTRVEVTAANQLHIGDHSFPVDYWTGLLPESTVHVHLVECPYYFDRKQIYTADPDEGERFLFFQQAILSILRLSGSAPDILHCNDWQTALLPALLEQENRRDNFFTDTHTLLTIHNLAYQGCFDLSLVSKAGLDHCKTDPGQTFEYYGQFSFLKAGICLADRISTVSPSYAEEICWPEQGAGLDGVIRSRSDTVVGILNGIDVDSWNPTSDPHLSSTWNASDLRGKKACRDRLLKKSGLKVVSELSADERIPLAGIVSRFAWQKGFDLLLSALEPFLNQKRLQLVVLGSGESAIEDEFRRAEERYPDLVALETGYNEPLAHLIEGGSDLFLMPSRFEPCGLNQMYSLAYGTIPVVRHIGGLRDTITDADLDPKNGNGFAFVDFDTDSLSNALDRALAAYQAPLRWETIQRCGMRAEHSWSHSARKYLSLYRAMIAA